MSVVKIKSFWGHKQGIGFWEGADRVAMNLHSGRFAVADGVSQSHLSNIWANIICQSYVKSSLPAYENWIEHYVSNEMVSDCHLWESQAEEVMRTAPSEKAFLLQLTQEEYRYAGSTLAGIVVEKQKLFYHVLGDSCIFVFDNQGRLEKCLSTVKEGESITTHPDYLCSGGRMVGVPLHGILPLKTGYVMIMTDAFSDWFKAKISQHPSFVNKLWELSCHGNFIHLVESARDNDDIKMKDDDVALLMLRIEDGDSEQHFEVVYSDSMEELLKLDETSIEIIEKQEIDKDLQKKTEHEVSESYNLEPIIITSPPEESPLKSETVGKQDEISSEEHDSKAFEFEKLLISSEGTQMEWPEPINEFQMKDSIHVDDKANTVTLRELQPKEYDPDEKMEFVDIQKSCEEQREDEVSIVAHSTEISAPPCCPTEAKVKNRVWLHMLWVLRKKTYYFFLNRQL